MNDTQVVLTVEEPGERLDKMLARSLPELSRAQCQRLIKEGRVTIGGRPTKASERLGGGEQILVMIPEARETELVAEDIPLNIVYEDQDLLVVDKPGGMVVHPAAGHSRGTLVNAVLAHCPELEGVGGERRPGIVHRLDKETSGLVVVAKNDRALRYVQTQFKGRQVGKLYLALVEGRFPQNEVVIDAPIGRDVRARKRMAVIPPDSPGKARAAMTKVKLLLLYSDNSLLECRPITGRTHQIRVHLAFAGFPIVGDRVYGRRKQRLELEQHFLHASELTIRRPSDGKELNLRAPLPAGLRAVLDRLEPVP
jgi:23S rRNA pseudouridine1911/1915/1917 synthase